MSDRFGFSLALSGDGGTLVVGAPYEDSAATGVGGAQGDDSASDSGAVYAFVAGAGTWAQQAYIKASNTDPSDEFGEAVAVSGDGNELAVGVVHESSAATGIDGNQGDNSAQAAGALYVFERAAGTWTQQAYLKASNAEAHDDLGASVALSSDGTRLVGGADNEASAAVGVGGAQGDDSAPGAGAVYLFARASASWTQQAYVKASNTDAGGRCGGRGQRRHRDRRRPDQQQRERGWGQLRARRRRARSPEHLPQGDEHRPVR
jgi:hypothetical protein